MTSQTVLAKFTAIERRFLPIVDVITGRAKPFMHKTNCLLDGGQIQIFAFYLAELLIAIRPLGIEAALDAWDRHQDSDRQKQQAIEMALEKARSRLVESSANTKS